ncbi:peptidase M55 [Thermosipho affectus]|uniref:Peptidase M55 n=1 Tax=Thermosipho affectus TaxID=660294 RepID=A0ABX3IKU0_9BACT|nr:M55 family metallopeptidase [Thermosipho affectus]ONN28015.1 peptidase M55 [Thermosipho affectus]
MKIYVSLDFEGLGGITQWSDVEYGIKFKQHLLMEQLEKFLEAVGNNYVLISDSHAMGDNVLWEITKKFDNVEIISGGLRKDYMMTGLDETFDRVVFFGYHAGIGTRYAVMDHTYSSSSIHNIWINGKIMNEAIINAAYAGLYNVPVAMIIGDDKLKTQVNFKNLFYVETKTSLGRFSAKHKSMKKVLLDIENKTKQMIEVPREEFEIVKFEKPIELVVELSDTARADLVEMLPLVKRIDGRKVKLVHDDYRVVFDTILSMTFMASIVKYLGR